jgi:hypothetical protein
MSASPYERVARRGGEWGRDALHALLCEVVRVSVRRLHAFACAAQVRARTRGGCICTHSARVRQCVRAIVLNFSRTQHLPSVLAHVRVEACITRAPRPRVPVHLSLSLRARGCVCVVWGPGRGGGRS